ncbi:MAG: hypothetical protein L3J42_00930 [Hydrogenimonas sp.]|nr:hypothetical protein [Hydrogenimonas sp.]
MRDILALLLLAVTITAAPTESRLFGPDALVNYKRCLSELGRERSETADTKLKRSLLYKPINITKYAKEHP